MILQACQNCWFNGLQFGAAGLPVGYCARHRKVLKFADATTCGQHLRKDLSLARANEVSLLHSSIYAADRIVRWREGAEKDIDTSSSDKDIDVIRRDPIGDIVIDYGVIGSSISTIARLSSIYSARSDVAMTSLGRSYVRNCARMGGQWTSGLHIFWWTKKRLADVPLVEIQDIRFADQSPLERQVELIAWSIMMFRITLLDDIVQHALEAGDEVGKTQGLADHAASSVSVFNTRKLSNWIRKDLIPLLDERLPRRRYEELAAILRQKTEFSDNTQDAQ